jgi:hypothetical protein
MAHQQTGIDFTLSVQKDEQEKGGEIEEESKSNFRGPDALLTRLPHVQVVGGCYHRAGGDESQERNDGTRRSGRLFNGVP